MLASAQILAAETTAVSIAQTISGPRPRPLRIPHLWLRKTDLGLLRDMQIVSAQCTQIHHISIVKHTITNFVKLRFQSKLLSTVLSALEGSLAAGVGGRP